MRTVEIFWTGGYDSSFRVLQLSRCPVRIKPYYLSDGRRSEPNELAAIAGITELLKAKPETQCEFLPLEILTKSDRKKVDAVSEAYARLRSRDHIGSQYEWLGWFATEHEGIEISVHEQAIALIRKYGALKRVSDEVTGDHHVIDRERSEADIVAVFGNYRFPLAEYTKLKMRECYAAMGAEDVMALTWFCYRPKGGKPCGTCHPCQCTIEEGLAGRFTGAALARYRLKRTGKRLLKAISIRRR